MAELSLLDKEIARLEKEYGKGSIISKKSEQIDVISTGSLKLDLATGIGGFPRGRIVELIGWESSGKSTIAQNVVANGQKKGLKCLYMDGEFSLDPTYAAALGISMDDLIVYQLDEGGGEKCYNVAEGLIKTGEIGVAIIDSQTAMLPKKVMEGSVGDNALGLHARMMSTAIPKLMTAAAIGNCLVVVVSQLREKIGVMFGSPETTNGGNALKFYSHMRVDFRKSVIREDGKATGNKTKGKIIKNKVAPPYGEAEFDIIFGKGVDTLGEIVDLSVDNEIIRKGGAWYSYGPSDNPTFKAQGEDKLRELLRDNPELLKEVEDKVFEKLKS